MSESISECVSGLLAPHGPWSDYISVVRKGVLSRARVCTSISPAPPPTIAAIIAKIRVAV